MLDGGDSFELKKKFVPPISTEILPYPFLEMNSKDLMPIFVKTITHISILKVIIILDKNYTLIIVW